MQEYRRIYGKYKLFGRGYVGIVLEGIRGVRGLGFGLRGMELYRERVYGVTEGCVHTLMYSV